MTIRARWSGWRWRATDRIFLPRRIWRSWEVLRRAGDGATAERADVQGSAFHFGAGTRSGPDEEVHGHAEKELDAILTLAGNFIVVFLRHSRCRFELMGDAVVVASEARASTTGYDGLICEWCCARRGTGVRKDKCWQDGSLESSGTSSEPQSSIDALPCR